MELMVIMNYDEFRCSQQNGYTALSATAMMRIPPSRTISVYPRSSAV